MIDHFLTLKRLGLSSNQAKVYLGLLALNRNATVMSISQSCGVHREEIYRKMRELADLGFVEVIITRPLKFKAVQLKFVINILLRRMSEEISNLQIESEKLLLDFENNRKEPTPKEGNFDLLLIPKNRALLQRLKTEVDNLQDSLDTICTFAKGISWLKKHNVHFKRALNRNVTIRFIIQKSEKTKIPKFVIKLQNYDNFQLRSTRINPPACAGIYDRKQILIDVSSKAQFLKSPAICSNNPSILGMAKIYFNKMWMDSLPVLDA